MSTIRDRYKKIGESEWFKKHYHDKPLGETIDILDDVVNNQKELPGEFADNIDSYRKEVDVAYQKGYKEGVKAALESAKILLYND